MSRQRGWALLAVVSSVFLTAVTHCASGEASTPVLAPTPAPAASALFPIIDPRIPEASGIARGIAAPDVFWVHNDSGNDPVLYALDVRTGAVRGAFTVPDVTNVDWEDIAVATDARGVASIWIADTGDNDSERAEVRIYRVDEPRISDAGESHDDTTTAADLWRLRYDDGPRDVEALAVAPGGRMWLIDKVVVGATDVYRVPLRADRSRVQTIPSVATFQTRSTSTPGGPNELGRVTVTGASLNLEGLVLAVRTYTDAYVWPVTDDDVAAAVRTAPRIVALPSQAQGEGITVDGRSLVIDGEGTGSTVYRVPLPRLPPPSHSAPVSSPPLAAGQATGRPRATRGIILAGAGGALLVGAAWIAMTRARRKYRRT